ncbi:hypothetical protein Tco_1532771 [Tanacetum coccineum]
MAFDLRPTEDVLPWPGNANMSFDLRGTKNVLSWPGNANMAFDLRRTKNVLPWPGNVTNASCLDDGRVCREMVNEFAPPKFFASVRRMEHDQLFTEFNVGAARQMSLSAEVGMRAEYNIKEKRILKSHSLRAELIKFEAVTDLAASVAVREREVADLDTLVTFVKSQNDKLVDRVHELEVSLLVIMKENVQCGNQITLWRVTLHIVFLQRRDSR